MPDQIQPASLDLRLGEVAYRVRASFLPGPHHGGRSASTNLKLHEFALTDGAVLETGCVYIVPLLESLALPDDISAAANPKSSTGRLDVFTRVIADETRAASTASRPAITARSMPRSARALSRCWCARARGCRRCASATATRCSMPMRCASCTRASGWSMPTTPMSSEGVAVGVDLSGLGPGGLVGYRAKRHTGLIDVERRGGYAVARFLGADAGAARQDLILDPNEFYILASKEAVQVPPDYAAEMVPFDPLVGEFRVHYAGFFDPGFGYAGAGGKGARAVLEVRSREVPFILEHGQIVGRLVYEKMIARPEQLYGQGIGSNYQAQGLKLSKHFKS